MYDHLTMFYLGYYVVSFPSQPLYIQVNNYYMYRKYFNTHKKVKKMACEHKNKKLIATNGTYQLWNTCRCRDCKKIIEKRVDF